MGAMPPHAWFSQLRHLLVGAMPPHAGQEVPFHLIRTSASGSFAPASGSKIHGVQPPLPFGPPPAKLVLSLRNVVVNRDHLPPRALELQLISPHGL